MSRDLELAALQSLWSLGNASPEVAQRVLDETGAGVVDVADEVLRPLWAAVEERIRARRPLDTVAMAQSLAPLGVHPAVVASLAEWVLPGVERERLLALRDAAARRRCLDAMRLAAGRLKGGAPLAELEAELRALPALVSGVKPRVRSAKGDTGRILDAAEEAWRNKRGPSLRTGYDEFDAVLRLTPNLHAVGAHPGVGKSALVAGLVRAWTHQGVAVGVLAYEDDGLDLQRRILAAEAELDLSAVSGDRLLDNDEMGRWAAGHRVREEAERFLLIDDEHPRGTVAEVCASLRTMRAQGAQVAILDNLSCVRMDADDERHLAIEAALLEIRETALALRMPVIVVGHLKRSITSANEVATEPRLTDFAGAASWERFARSCCGMWRGEGGPMLVVLKQNAGRVGDRFHVDMMEKAACVTGLRLAPPEEARTTARRSY
jgi:hypothetical protein